MWVGFSDDVLRGRLKKIVQASAIYLKLILPNLPAVGRILESDTLYYFLFHVGYKYPTYNLNGSFSDDLYTGYGQAVCNPAFI